MVTARATTLVAATGSTLAALALLSANTTGWRGLLAGLAFWAGAACLATATVLVARDRAALAGALPRIGFLLVAAGFLTFLAGVAATMQGALEPGSCGDTESCAPPGSETARLLDTGAAILLLSGAATLLAGLPRTRDGPVAA